MSENTQGLEDSIKRHKTVVALHDSLVRLRSNRDFKAIFTEGYFKSEAIRLVSALSEPEFQNDKSQKDLLKQIDGIGALLNFFRTLDYQAGQAAKQIEADEATLEEIRGGDDVE